MYTEKNESVNSSYLRGGGLGSESGRLLFILPYCSVLYCTVLFFKMSTISFVIISYFDFKTYDFFHFKSVKIACLLHPFPALKKKKRFKHLSVFLVVDGVFDLMK